MMKVLEKVLEVAPLLLPVASISCGVMFIYECVTDSLTLETVGTLIYVQLGYLMCKK
ncbi:hypothetical protein SAMN05444972_11948 [Marininema halotolerans]|uniref:Uncharacterized protein n=1 Tax=Marininema halotolerans TaxID=1155944 RepID=A0A1I6US36_9BACL|nr:hypothetical protein SAMN05444972_11948 [Marininema halotolerans]